MSIFLQVVFAIVVILVFLVVYFNLRFANYLRIKHTSVWEKLHKPSWSRIPSREDQLLMKEFLDKEGYRDLKDPDLNSLVDLKKKISSKTAAVFVDNPSYFGVLEDQVERIAEIAHAHDALSIVSVDPSSLGAMRPPGDYHADIVVGSGQPLGLHMNYGGNSLGFFACRSDPKYLDQLPGYVAAVTPTMDGKDKAYLDTLWEKRHFFFQRENATSMIGSSSNLCAIGAAVYLSLLGPEGMRELGEGIIQRTRYAIQEISKIKKIGAPAFNAPHFKEFIVNFDRTGKTVREVNRTLLNKHGIVGGKDLSHDFPELGQSALFCVTEIHTSQDIDKLVHGIRQL